MSCAICVALRCCETVAGESATLMFDANQHWNLPDARRMCGNWPEFKPLWIEEPTHPDDVYAHADSAREIAPVKLPPASTSRTVFSSRISYVTRGMHFVQADCTRLAGISEFLTVSLMARKFGLPIVPHVGDMGQLHQHLVLFNHIALDHEVVFLEHIPHLREHFVFPAEIDAGFYKTPQAPGASSDMILTAGKSR